MNESKEFSKIPGKSIFGFSLGNFGIGIIWAVLATFLTYYLTDISEMPIKTVGFILLISRIFDGISDLIMGTIVEKVKSKHGKARPLLLVMSIPLAISFIMLFSVPVNASETFKVIYVFITYNLVTTIFYTACVVPYSALLPLMTRNQNSKSKTNIIKTAVGSLATLLVSMLSLKFIKLFSNEQQAWQYLAIIYGVILVITLTVTFFTTAENVKQVSEIKEKISLKMAVKLIYKNKYAMQLLFLSIVLSTSLFPGLFLYYGHNVLGNAQAIGLITLATLVPQALCIIILQPLIRRHGKKKLALLGGYIYIFGSLFLFINPESMTIVLIATVFRGLGLAPFALTQYSFLSDAVEYGEWKTKRRTEGLVNSAGSFGNKLGTGIGTFVVTFFLSFAGYDGSLGSQTSQTITVIKYLFILAPLVIGIIYVIVLKKYDLDERYNDILKDLKNGKFYEDSI